MWKIEWVFLKKKNPKHIPDLNSVDLTEYHYLALKEEQ
jgi:hypothetical protein